MFIDILREHEGKNVEVSTSAGKTYVGTLKIAGDNTVVITPTAGSFCSKRYGNVFIREGEAVSIREVLPYVDKKSSKSVFGHVDFSEADEVDHD